MTQRYIKKYVTNKKEIMVLYVELKQSLYRTLQAALIFWRNLTLILQWWDFKINPYNWCVAKNTVDGKKIIVVWHVYDLKISYENGNMVDALISKLSERYGT